MTEPSDMILPLLREMRAENLAEHQRTQGRLDKMEAALVTFRHALSADSLLSKIVTGEFEEKLDLLERRMSRELGEIQQRVKELEGQK